MTNKNKIKLYVYYDGLCHLCTREIRHYLRADGADQIQFVDITTKSFDAQKEGLDPFAVHKVMHVKTPDGKILTAVDAFREIWRVLPGRGYKILLTITGWFFVRPVLDMAYHAFAAARPYLPKRKTSCGDSPYCDI